MSDTAASEPLVSVIIPVYNAAKYLRETLDCVCNQTLRNIEIICVDDGSTDDSPGILQEYAARDPRFRILHQQNRYAGVARNNGMAAARGKYLSFLDADDLFEPDMLEKMSARAEETGADMVCCDAVQFEDSDPARTPQPMTWILENVPKDCPECFEPRALLGDQIFQSLCMTPWNKLYLSSHVKSSGNKWQAVPYGNDACFVLLSIYLSQKAAIVREPLIRYRKRRASISHSSRRDVSVQIAVWEAIRERLERIHAGEAAMHSFREFFFASMHWFISSLTPGQKEQLRELGKEGSCTFLSTMLEECPGDCRAAKQREDVRAFFRPRVSFLVENPQAEYLSRLATTFKNLSYPYYEVLVPVPQNDDALNAAAQEWCARDANLRLVTGGNQGEGMMATCRQLARTEKEVLISPPMVLRPNAGPIMHKLAREAGDLHHATHQLLERLRPDSPFLRRTQNKVSFCLFGKALFSVFYTERDITYWLLGQKIWQKVNR